MLKSAFQGILLIGIFGCVLLAMMAMPSSSATQPTPTLTLPTDNSAAIVHEMGVIVQPIVDASANAVRADTNTAHPSPTPIPPSETERIAKAVALPAAASAMCLGAVVLGFAALLLWNNEQRRKAELERQRIAAQVAQSQIADLKAVIASLREYQQAADVSPRNNEEENEIKAE